MFTAIACLGGIGLIAAATLGIAARKFAVEVNPREAAILAALPGANCGACGEPGCAGYARAVAEGRLPPTLCPPGGQETAAALAEILGVEVSAADPRVAVVLCQGGTQQAQIKYQYLGLQDCGAAQKLAEGPKACPGGCLGLGSCARACPFGAIEMTTDGLALIRRDRCTGCEQCLQVCPRNVIVMAPARVTIHVLCNSHDRGAAVRKYCQIGCIGCNICKKTAPAAYLIDNFLARVDYEHPEDAQLAIAKCPMHCIHDFSQGDPPAEREKPSTIAGKNHAA
ncbi:MAG: RnfABCDGE type electron transport complex subunit B [Pelovirga sp.]